MFFEISDIALSHYIRKNIWNETRRVGGTKNCPFKRMMELFQVGRESAILGLLMIFFFKNTIFSRWHMSFTKQNIICQSEYALYKTEMSLSWLFNQDWYSPLFLIWREMQGVEASFLSNNCYNSLKLKIYYKLHRPEPNPVYTWVSIMLAILLAYFPNEVYKVFIFQKFMVNEGHFSKSLY